MNKMNFKSHTNHTIIIELGLVIRKKDPEKIKHQGKTLKKRQVPVKIKHPGKVSQSQCLTAYNNLISDFSPVSGHLKGSFQGTRL